MTWLKRGKDYIFKESIGETQPVVAFIEKHDRKIDYSKKNGYQGSIGNFAGRTVHATRVYKTKREAKRVLLRRMRTLKTRGEAESYIKKAYLRNAMLKERFRFL